MMDNNTALVVVVGMITLYYVFKVYMVNRKKK